MKYLKKTILICINVVKNHTKPIFFNRYIGTETNEWTKRVKALVTHTIVEHRSQLLFLKDTYPNLRQATTQDFRLATNLIFQPQTLGGLNGRNSYLG